MTRKVHQLHQPFAGVLPLQRWQSPVPANSAGFGCATRYAPKPPTLLHVHLAEVTSAHKAPPHPRLQTSEPASPCSILHPAKTSSPLPPPRAEDAGQQAARALANLFKLWPRVLALRRGGGISSARHKQLQGGEGETSTARL